MRAPGARRQLPGRRGRLGEAAGNQSRRTLSPRFQLQHPCPLDCQHFGETHRKRALHFRSWKRVPRLTVWGPAVPTAVWEVWGCGPSAQGPLPSVFAQELEGGGLST